MPELARKEKRRELGVRGAAYLVACSGGLF
jgi:hypothetical protein